MTTAVEVPRKQNVLGVNISLTSYQEVVRYCCNVVSTNARTGSGRYVCVTSVHGIITARDDRELGRILNEADIATPDGMPIVWALRSFGASRQQRVYGPNLMMCLCEDAAYCGHRVFLYGGREDTLGELTLRLRERFPALQIAGAYAPPFRPLTPEEDDAVSQRIQQSGAELIFVGISTPKQERWMAAHRERFPGTVMVGVGAAFDFHAGKVKQAPEWMQKHGLEWFFRLCVEPARLWKRYLLVTPRFLPLWAMQRFFQ